MKRGSNSVDIICCVRNPGSSFVDTVNSVLNQTFTKFKLIVVDDGSTKLEHISFLKHLQVIDERVNVFFQPMSLGLTKNLYDQVRRSRAEFIARIDAGDTWDKNKLAIQVKYMLEHKDLLILGTQCIYANKCQNLGRSWFKESYSDILTSVEYRRGIFEHSSILFRNELNYREAFTYSQDLDLYLRAIIKGRIECLPDILTKCQINFDGITINKRFLQLHFQRLAYKSFNSVCLNGRDVDLSISLKGYEPYCWSLSKYFYKKYVLYRTTKASSIMWASNLLVAMLIYPPLLLDNYRRVFKSNTQSVQSLKKI